MPSILRQYWESIRASLWFVPALMGAGAVLLAVLMLSWAPGVPKEEASYWLLYSGSAENARELLAALLSGMITMTSLVVSITMVVLTLAAGQIGPRLIRTFIQDRVTQAVLGLFIADILYLLVVFRTIDGEGEGGIRVPHLAVTTGTVITALCMFVLLIHVHRLARSIIYDNVVRAIADELRRNTIRLLPERGDERRWPAPPGDGWSRIELAVDGYVQTIDLDALVEAAREAEAVIRLDMRPGDFVTAAGDHVAVHPAGAGGAMLCRRVREAVMVGSERTEAQDIAYSIRQMAEIATRALSPGLNDVFTALAVIDNLSAALAHALDRGAEPPVAFDGGDRPRVFRRVATDRTLIDAAFDPVRREATGNPTVMIRLVEAIARMAPAVRTAEQRDALLAQLAAIRAAAERTVQVPRDLELLRERERIACARLARTGQEDGSARHSMAR